MQLLSCCASSFMCTPGHLGCIFDVTASCKEDAQHERSCMWSCAAELHVEVVKCVEMHVQDMNYKKKAKWKYSSEFDQKKRRIELIWCTADQASRNRTYISDLTIPNRTTSKTAWKIEAARVPFAWLASSPHCLTVSFFFFVIQNCQYTAGDRRYKGARCGCRFADWGFGTYPECTAGMKWCGEEVKRCEIQYACEKIFLRNLC